MLEATIYIRSYKVAAEKSIVQTMEVWFDHGLDPKKLGALSSYLCDPDTTLADFLLVKSQYQAEIDQTVGNGTLFFQIRQAFSPGEVTSEEADEIGYVLDKGQISVFSLPTLTRTILITKFISTLRSLTAPVSFITS